MVEEAIILAGGKGTRLKAVVSDIPKPLAPVNNTPFLTYLLKYLKKQGLKHIILSVGYKWEMIKEIYGEGFEGMNITYAVEETPLGTGGAIALSFQQAKTKDILILNGDSFIDFNLKGLYEFHKVNNSSLSIVLKEMKDFERYGSVVVGKDRIFSFCEKKFTPKGFINTGVYLANRDIFKVTNLEGRFSFEQDYLEKEVSKGNFCGYKTEGYFIDIGIPEDYKKANIDFKELWK